MWDQAKHSRPRCGPQGCQTICGGPGGRGRRGMAEFMTTRRESFWLVESSTGVGRCFFGGTENMRALTSRLLLAASNRLLDRSGSSPSRTNHQGLTWVLKGLTRLRVRQCSNAQEHLQEEASKVTKPVSCEQRWVRQAVVRTCRNNEINEGKEQ